MKAVLYDERHADETAGNGIKRALCNAHSACKLAFPAGIEPTAFRLGVIANRRFLLKMDK